MTKGKWYSPQISREIVSRLYFKAKAERIPMTVLANRIMEQALGTDPLIGYRRDTASEIAASDEYAAGPVKSPAIAPR
jgi:hypothetical protein